MLRVERAEGVLRLRASLDGPHTPRFWCARFVGEAPGGCRHVEGFVGKAMVVRPKIRAATFDNKRSPAELVHGRSEPCSCSVSWNTLLELVGPLLSLLAWASSQHLVAEFVGRKRLSMFGGVLVVSTLR